MKGIWKKTVAGLIVAAGLTPAVRAQVPAAPVVAPIAVPPAPGAPGVPIVAAEAAPKNLFSFLCPTAEQCAACKAKICNSVFGQFLNNSLMPASAFSGGIIPLCCPQVPLADLAKPADSAEGAAARIAADEAEAKKRRAAIRILAGADCSRWPEAQDALINGLRLDRNECVRMEAAIALGRGCCCTKPVIKALALSASGADDDGAPSERSPRVRAAAQMALDHCLSCYVEVVPAPLPGGERPKEGPGTKKEGTTAVNPADYYRQIASQPRQQVVDDVRQMVRVVPMPTGTPVTAPATQPRADRSISGLMQSAWTPPATPTVEAPRPMAPPPVAPKPEMSMPPQTVQIVDTTTGERRLVPTSPSTPEPSRVPAQARTVPMVPTPTAPPTRPVPAPVETPIIKTSYHPTPTQAAPAAPQPMPQSMPPVNRTSLLPAPSPAPMVAAPVLPTNPSYLLGTLSSAQSAEQREWAALSLSAFDGWLNPALVQGLIVAVRTDAAPNVRAAAIHSLARMNIRTLPVISTVQAAKSDPDPRVRAEADHALAQLNKPESMTTAQAAGR